MGGLLEEEREDREGDRNGAESGPCEQSDRREIERGREEGREKGEESGPPSKGEPSECAQEVVLVPAAEDTCCQGPKGRPVQKREY